MNKSDARKFMVADLKRSGLTTKDIVCSPLTGDEGIVLMYGNRPGKPVRDNPPPAGYIIPAPDINGNIPDPKTGRWRIRFMEPWCPNDKDPAKYRGKAGAKPYLYFHKGVDWKKRFADPGCGIYIVEGEKKAAKLCKSGFPAIGISGVWNWMKDGNPINEIRSLPWAGHPVNIVFDSDKQTNPNIMDAERELADFLIDQGAVPYAVELPTLNGFDKTGVDDFLVHHKGRGKTRFIQLPKTGLLMPEGGTAADLLKEKIPEPYWAVPGLIPEGVTLLAGAPKAGKSWAALEIGIAVASGTKAFGQYPVNRSEVLYLSLEDTPKRLQGRIAILSHAGKRAVSHLHPRTTWPTMEGHCFKALETHLKQHPNTKLVIIDVLEKVRGQRTASESVYSHEYNTMAPISAFARKHGLAIIVIHHTRKGRDNDDQLNDVSGTTGLSAAADTICVMRKAGINSQLDDATRTWYARGRDIDEIDFALSLDIGNKGGWSYLGDTWRVQASETRQQILSAMDGSSTDKRLTPKQIEEATGIPNRNHKLANMLRRMKNDGFIEGSGVDGYYVPEPSPLAHRLDGNRPPKKGERGQP
ncbi:MAG TPA: DUF3854 domain-containing protein [Gammaproteobacteria bacterium]|nr:DUF3854 domain-containing protein [Gammaproteobacteria bacterium]